MPISTRSSMGDFKSHQIVRNRSLQLTDSKRKSLRESLTNGIFVSDVESTSKMSNRTTRKNAKESPMRIRSNDQRQLHTMEHWNKESKLEHLGDCDTASEKTIMLQTSPNDTDIQTIYSPLEATPKSPTIYENVNNRLGINKLQSYGKYTTAKGERPQTENNAISISFVLKAALDMLEEKANWEAQVLEHYRATCPDFPPRNEAILTGTLKKAKDGQFLHWKPKFVAISPGKMTYLANDEVQMSKLFPGKESTSRRKSKKKEIKLKLAKHVPLNASRVSCRCIDKKSYNDAGKYVFEISYFEGTGRSLKKSSRLWMASSEEERSRWVHAIKTAMCPELLESADGNPVLLNQCDAVSSRMNQCDTELEYLNALVQEFKIDLQQLSKRLQHMVKKEKQTCQESFHDHTLDSYNLATVSFFEETVKQDFDDSGSVIQYGSDSDSNTAADCDENAIAERDICFDKGSGPHENIGCSIEIPIEWVQGQLKRVRGDVNPSMEQVFKDMQRDSVTINGKLYYGDGGGDANEDYGNQVSDIIAQLAQTIRNKSGGVKITEAQALAFSREVLLACNRTQSGGSSFEAVDSLLKNRGLVMLLPDSVHAEPLRITVFNEEDDSLSNQSITQNESVTVHGRNTNTVAQMNHSTDSDSDQYRSKAHERNNSNGTKVSTDEGNDQSDICTEECEEDDLLNYSGASLGKRVRKLRGTIASKHNGDVPAPKNASRNGNSHRRTASEPLSAIFQQLSIGKQSSDKGEELSRTSTLTPKASGLFHNRFASVTAMIHSRDNETQVKVTGPRVNVEASMVYKICCSAFENEQDSVLGYATALYKRSFVLSGNSSVAIGQGVVEVSVDLSESSLTKLQKHAKHLSIADLPPQIMIPSDSLHSPIFAISPMSPSSPIPSPQTNGKPSKTQKLPVTPLYNFTKSGMKLNTLKRGDSVFSEAKSLITKTMPVKKRK